MPLQRGIVVGIADLVAQIQHDVARDSQQKESAEGDAQEFEEPYANIQRQMAMDAMTPTVSAVKPASTAWRVRRMLTEPK